MKVGEHTLGVHHAIVLLDLHDDDGRSTTQRDHLELLVAGALVAELLHAGRIVHDHGSVHLRAGRPASRVLEPVEEAIGARPVRLDEVLRTVAEGGHRHAVHSDLVGRGVLKVTRRRKWMMFQESTWPTADPTLERALIAHLREVARSPVEAFCPEDSVFSLMRAGGLQHAVFERPVDVLPRARRCPIGSEVLRLFEAQTTQMENN